MNKTKVTIDDDLQVTKLYGIYIVADESNGELERVEIECKSQEGTTIQIALEIDGTDTTITGYEHERFLFPEEFPVSIEVFIEILKSVTAEPLKSIAQPLADILTVKFADVIKEGK